MEKRKTFEQKSVLAYMKNGETYAEAKARLDREWAAGHHPAQLAAKARKEK